jgi:hypothetical protein
MAAPTFEAARQSALDDEEGAPKFQMSRESGKKQLNDECNRVGRPRGPACRDDHGMIKRFKPDQTQENHSISNSA